MKNRMVKGIKKTLIAVTGLATFGLADNPISSYHYLADPAAASDGETFYIIADSDDPAPDSDYDIRVLYAFSSKDMKNWTDYGIIFGSKREYPCHWNGNQEICFAANTWASGIGISKDGKFHIVFPDGGGGGIGLLEANSIEGPYVNPLPNEKKLINNWGGGYADCDGVDWCFDPAIFFDKDGTGYFTFGGGSKTGRVAEEGNNNIFDIYKFNSDNKTFDVTSKVQLKIGGPKAMEASYIHRKDNTYYLSYSTADLRIAYGTSSSPTGPYTYQGIFMDNPNINGANINANNNNHHGIAEFQGHWYVVYHDRRLVQADEHPKAPNSDNPSSPVPAFHRSVSIDEFTYNGDKINKLTFTNEGPEQINDFNPYETYPALTSSKQRNIRSYTDWNNNDWSKGIAAKHVLTPYATKESWIRVSGVNFGTEGAKSFKVVASSIRDDNKIEIHTGSPTGTAAGTCTLKKTENQKISNTNDKGELNYYDVDREGKFTKFDENECTVSGLTGKVSELYIVFKGTKDTTMGVLEWSFTCSGSNCKASEPQKQTPFGGVAANIPGKIEAENFDVPGSGYANKSYSEGDTEDHGAESNGGTSYREGTGVDIYKSATGYAVGYNADGEWLEWTVNVAEAGNYTIFASVATDNKTSGFTLSLDGEPLASFDLASFERKGTDFDAFDTVQANVNITTAGTHILRMTVTGAWFDVDFFAFAKGNDAKIDDVPTALPKLALFNAGSTITYNVFDLRGGKVASFTIKNGDNVDIKATVTNLVKRSGFYLLKSSHGGAVKRIAITK